MRVHKLKTIVWLLVCIGVLAVAGTANAAILPKGEPSGQPSEEASLFSSFSALGGEGVRTFFDGWLTTDSTFLRPYLAVYTQVYAPGGMTVNDGVPFNYFVRTIVPSVSGNYTFWVDSAPLTGPSGPTNDTVLFIYEGGFSPDQPMEHVLWGNDDTTDENLLSRIPDVFLEANTTYYLVMTSYQDGVTGYVSFYAEGDAEVSVGDPTGDTLPPVPGDGGQITVDAVGTNSADLSWAAANDDQTEAGDLMYKVVMSFEDNIGTVSAAEDAVEEMAWAPDVTSFRVTPLSQGTTYYFTVLVKDAAGNKSVYSSVAATTLAPISIAVTADAQSKTYGSADPALTYRVTAGALEPGDAFSGSLSRASGEDVGTYEIRQGSLTAPPRYIITFEPADLTVTARDVEVTAEAATKVYGNADPAFGYQVTEGSLVDGDAFSGALTCGGVNVGEHDITLGTLGLSSNYHLSFVPAKLTITQRDLTVTADAKSKVYGADDPELTYHVSGLVLGDSLSGALQREAGEGVEHYAIGQGDLSASSNYSLSFTGAVFEIQPRSLVVTANDVSKTYDGQAYSGFTVRYSGFVPDEDESVLGGLLGFEGSAVGATEFGTYQVTPNGLTSDNYAITYLPGELTITKRPLTVTAENKTKVYDGATYSGFTVSCSGFAGSESATDLAGTLSFSGSAVAAVNAGTYSIVPSGLAADNYSISFENGTLTIAQRELTAVVGNYSKTYGSENPGFTVEVTGFITGEDAGSAAGYQAPSANCAATATTGVGTAQITISGGGADNYSFDLNDTGTLTITAKQLVATATAADKTYDGSTNATGQIQLSGIVGSDDVSGTGTFAFQTADAGHNKPVNVTDISLGGTKAANYSVNTTANASADIDQLALDLTALASDKTYDGTLAASGELQLVGIIDGDDVTATGSFAFRDAAAGGPKAVDVTAIRLAGDQAGNYSVSDTIGTTASILKANITGVTFDGATFTYSGAEQSIQLTGELPAGATVNYTGNRRTDAGTDQATANITGGSNYHDLTLSATLVIEPKQLVATATASGKTYDGSRNGTGQVHLAGIIGGDVVTASGTFTFETAAARDDQAVQVTQIALAGAQAENYTVNTEAEAQASITSRALTATATAQGKTYDGTIDASGQLQLAGLVDGDQVTASGTFSFRDALAGTGKAVDAVGITLSGADAGNYTVNLAATASADIDRAPLTATATASDKNYDGSNTGSGQVHLAGIIGDDIVTATGTFTFETAAARDDQAVQVTQIALAGAQAGNYTVNTEAEAQASIAKRELTATATAQGKTYDGTTDASGQLQLAGLVDGDQVTVSGTFSFRDALAGTGKPVDAVGIILSGSEAGNYTVNLVASATADIDPAPLTATATAEDKTYDGTTTAAGTISLEGIIGDDQVTASGTFTFAGADAATDVTVSVSAISLDGDDAGNYSVATTASTTASIAPRAISAVGITAASRYYDGTAIARLGATAAALDGVLPGDVVTLNTTQAVGSFANPNIGQSKSVTVTGLALAGAQAGNYQLNPYTTTASIWEEEEPPKPPTPPTPPTDNGGVVIVVNGEIQDQSATATTSVVEDKTITTVTINPDKLAERLEREGENSTVTIPVNTGADVVTGELTGQTVKQMENKSAVLEIKTENVTYTLPAAQINIDAVSGQIGEQVELKDITVRVTVAAPPADTVKIVEDTANRNSYQVVVKPVDFEITCTSGDKTVAVSKFNGYVERTVAIPDGIDPSKITTGIVLNADGTFSHVPTTIIKIDGKYYAKINSLTNSTYSVIWNPLEFKDVVGHWAQAAINDMGSRLVMTADSDGNFQPKQLVTRRDFAVTLVKALGLRPTSGDSPFVDLNPQDEAYGYMLTAYQYNLMSGYPGDNFLPDRLLTRQEAMSIVVAAMRLTKLQGAVSAEEVAQLLSAYSDADQVGSWASNVVAACLKSGVIGGKPGERIAPREQITRAEVAVIMQRLLELSQLI